MGVRKCTLTNTYNWRGKKKQKKRRKKNTLIDVDFELLII